MNLMCCQGSVLAFCSFFFFFLLQDRSFSNFILCFKLRNKYEIDCIQQTMQQQITVHCLINQQLCLFLEGFHRAFCDIFSNWSITKQKDEDRFEINRSGAKQVIKEILIFPTKFYLFVFMVFCFFCKRGLKRRVIEHQSRLPGEVVRTLALTRCGGGMTQMLCVALPKQGLRTTDLQGFLPASVIPWSSSAKL